jgi:hypothetical protein
VVGFQLVKLDEIAVTNRSGDLAGAIVIVVGAIQDQE